MSVIVIRLSLNDNPYHPNIIPPARIAGGVVSPAARTPVAIPPLHALPAGSV